MRRPYALLAAATLLGAANLLLRFPGEPNPDSDDQYRQILSQQYNDWHPPVMARLWSLLRLMGDGPGPMFSFHVALYWVGFGIVATALARQSRPFAAWSMLAVGALPPLLMLNINIAKDIGLGVTLLCAFGLCYSYKRRSRPLPAWAIIIATSLIAYAALVRGNAVFAIGPLLLYASPYRPLRLPIVALVAASLLLGIVLVPASTLVNRHLFNAAPGGAIESLQFFDVAGIARATHDESLFGAATVTEADLRRCYSPIMWDTLPQRCPELWAGVRGPLLGGPELTTSRPSLARLWVAAVQAHPWAYVEHRLLSFNSTLYLYVPSHHTEYVRMLATAANRSDRWPARILDGVRYNWVTAPATMLALACSLLWFVWRTTTIATAEREAATALLLSSILYVASFLPFGVATDMRYFFWPTIAVLVATVLLAPTVVEAYRLRPLRLAAMFSPPALVLGVIAVARSSGDLSLLRL